MPYLYRMKQWMLRLCPAVGLVLVLVTLTSVLWPQPLPDTNKNALAVRQVGHDYLRAMGDSTSLIPAVREREDGSLVLPLGRCIDYDDLLAACTLAMEQYGIRQAYTLALEDYISGEIFLGSLIYPFPTEFDAVACGGRDQEDRLANISITFEREDKAATPTGFYWLGGFGFFLLVAAPLVGRMTAIRPADVPANASVAVVVGEPQALFITPTSYLNETALLLSIDGDEQDLTYREAKLLTYLANRPNEVLSRTDIHDAVWGEEGIITGRSLDVFVSRLRKKLAAADEVEIQTVHGVGYRFRVCAAVG